MPLSDQERERLQIERLEAAQRASEGPPPSDVPPKVEPAAPIADNARPAEIFQASGERPPVENLAQEIMSSHPVEGAPSVPPAVEVPRTGFMGSDMFRAELLSKIGNVPPPPAATPLISDATRMLAREMRPTPEGTPIDTPEKLAAMGMTQDQALAFQNAVNQHRLTLQIQRPNLAEQAAIPQPLLPAGLMQDRMFHQSQLQAWAVATQDGARQLGTILPNQRAVSNQPTNFKMASPAQAAAERLQQANLLRSLANDPRANLQPTPPASNWQPIPPLVGGEDGSHFSCGAQAASANLQQSANNNGVIQFQPGQTHPTLSPPAPGHPPGSGGGGGQPTDPASTGLDSSSDPAAGAPSTGDITAPPSTDPGTSADPTSSSTDPGAAATPPSDSSIPPDQQGPVSL